MASATSCASSTPPALACEAAGRRSGGLLGLGRVVLLVAVMLLVMLLVLLVVGGVMSVMLVMGRRHHRLRQRGREGESGQGGQQVANPHGGISFLLRRRAGEPEG